MPAPPATPGPPGAPVWPTDNRHSDVPPTPGPAQRVDWGVANFAPPTAGPVPAQPAQKRPTLVMGILAAVGVLLVGTLIGFTLLRLGHRNPTPSPTAGGPTNSAQTAEPSPSSASASTSPTTAPSTSAAPAIPAVVTGKAVAGRKKLTLVAGGKVVQIDAPGGWTLASTGSVTPRGPHAMKVHNKVVKGRVSYRWGSVVYVGATPAGSTSAKDAAIRSAKYATAHAYAGVGHLKISSSRAVTAGGRKAWEIRGVVNYSIRGLPFKYDRIYVLAVDLGDDGFVQIGYGIPGAYPTDITAGDAAMRSLVVK